MSKRLRVEIYVDRSGGHRWRLRARNGCIVGDGSEGYTTRSGLLRALAMLATHAEDAFDLARQDPDGHTATS